MYRDLFNGWSSNVKHLGRLGTNHVIAAGAVVGVLPFWMSNEYYKAQEANPFKFFAESFSFKKNKQSVDLFLNSIIATVKERLGLVWSVRYAENVVCKTCRILNPNGDNNRWKDELILEFPLISRDDTRDDNNSFLISYVGGRRRVFVGPLITHWAYHGVWMTNNMLYRQVERKLVTEQRFNLNNLAFGRTKSFHAHHSFYFFRLPW